MNDRASNSPAVTSPYDGRPGGRDGAGAVIVSTPSPVATKPSPGTNPDRSSADGRQAGRRCRPMVWSVLDLIWAFGDDSWSATLKIDTSEVVAASDGILLGQFLLDLTKAILNGRGREYLHRHTHIDADGQYVIDDDYLQITECEPATLANLGQQPPPTSATDDPGRSAPAA